MLHANAYGSAPPVTTASILAVPPLQPIVPAFIETLSATGSTTTTDAFAEHPLPSSTVTLYVPAAAEMVCDVSLLLHANEYGSTPPFTFASAIAVPPLQPIVPAVASTTSADGSVIVTVAFALHSLPSVTVTM